MRDPDERQVKSFAQAALVVAALLLGACSACPNCPTHTDPARIAAPASSR